MEYPLWDPNTNSLQIPPTPGKEPFLCVRRLGRNVCEGFILSLTFPLIQKKEVRKVVFEDQTE